MKYAKQSLVAQNAIAKAEDRDPNCRREGSQSVIRDLVRVIGNAQDIETVLRSHEYAKAQRAC